MAAWKSASVLPSPNLKIDGWCSSLPWLTSRRVVRPAASVSGPWNAYSVAVKVTREAPRSGAGRAQAAAVARAITTTVRQGGMARPPGQEWGVECSGPRAVARAANPMAIFCALDNCHRRPTPMRHVFRGRERLLPVVLSVALLLVAVAVSSLFPQSQATTGVIRGVVSDPSGTPIAGAQVTVHDVETNFERTVQTNERGVFVALLLPLGTYSVSARAVGYSQATRTGIPGHVGETVDLPRKLGALAPAPVGVGAQQTAVDPARVQASPALPVQAAAGPPHNGRNFLNLTLLTPNVAILQGPGGDEVNVPAQPGIHHNVP